MCTTILVPCGGQWLRYHVGDSGSVIMRGTEAHSGSVTLTELYDNGGWSRDLLHSLVSAGSLIDTPHQSVTR